MAITTSLSYHPGLDYEPCVECSGDWRRGVVVIEITNQPNAPNQPWLTPQMPGAFPTGRYSIIQRGEALAFGFPDFVITKGIMTTTVEGFNQIMGSKRGITLNQIQRKPIEDQV
jgi:hypothetical protein